MDRKLLKREAFKSMMHGNPPESVSRELTQRETDSIGMSYAPSIDQMCALVSISLWRVKTTQRSHVIISPSQNQKFPSVLTF